MIGVFVTFEYDGGFDRARVTGLYGVTPTIAFVDIAQVVDNVHA
jgi:hypothetical protein